MKKEVILSNYDKLFLEDRILENSEYANLRTKQNNGFINSNFFRKNIFNSTSRGKKIEYKKPKVVWQKEKKVKIAVSHSLHQKHADILSLIHTDYIDITKPSTNGSYTVYLSLYKLAKMMGYKYPTKATEKVKSFINDLRWTDFVVSDENWEYRNTILGSAYFSERKDVFIIEISGKSAKILAHTTGIKFDKELTHQIVAIPDKLSKIKAIIRYMLSSKPTTQGITLEYLFINFDIGQKGTEQTKRNKKFEFKNQLKENKDLLESFNIEYNEEEKKIYYKKQLEEITFELGINTNKLITKLEKNENIEPSSYEKYIGKKFKLNDILYEVISFANINKENNTADIEILNTFSARIGMAKASSLDNLRGYIDAFEG
jgi:hypothetical protein